MPGGVVELKLVGQAFGFGRRESLVQGGRRVGVEVVLDQHDLLGVGIVDVDQRLDWAQSMRVRRSLTITSRQPRSGSQTMNRLTTPRRSYS